MKWFIEGDFLCKCGCNMSVSQDLKNKLDEAREKVNTPFVINSGARCEAHNKKVGGSPTSSHLQGLAVDIAYKDDLQLAKIIYGLTRVGLRRFGINEAKKFVHTDISIDKSDAIFSY